MNNPPEAASQKYSVAAGTLGTFAGVFTQRREAESDLRAYIAEHSLTAFPLVVTAPNIDIGVSTIIQSFGVGPLKVNTVLLNWMQQMSRGIPGINELRYGRNLRNVFRLGSNIVILNAPEDNWNRLNSVPASKRRIDVWWWGNASSRLMLLLAYLVTRSDEWDDALIRVPAVGEPGRKFPEEVQRMLDEVRIDAQAYAFSGRDAEAVVSHSFDADLVFIPFRLIGTQLADPFGAKIEPLIDNLPVTALVLAAEDIDLAAEPEEGEAAEAAGTRDAADDAAKKAEKARKNADKAARQVEEKLKALQKAGLDSAPADEKERMERQVRLAREEAGRAAKKAALAAAKGEDALRTAEELESRNNNNREGG